MKRAKKRAKLLVDNMRCALDDDFCRVTPPANQPEDRPFPYYGEREAGFGKSDLSIADALIDLEALLNEILARLQGLGHERAMKYGNDALVKLSELQALVSSDIHRRRQVLA